MSWVPGPVTCAGWSGSWPRLEPLTSSSSMRGQFVSILLYLLSTHEKELQIKNTPSLLFGSSTQSYFPAKLPLLFLFLNVSKSVKRRLQQNAYKAGTKTVSY